jgi:5-methylthioadenosine/S-adenosylhomocysteine deaminase
VSSVISAVNSRFFAGSFVMKENVDIVIQADNILTMDADQSVFSDGAVAVKDGKVAAVGPADDIRARYAAARTIGGKGKTAFPGLINTHTHAAMVYFRGLADDLPLKVWLEQHIWPAEEKWLSPGFVGDAVELACLEMLKGGITSYADMYFFGDAVAHSTKKIGMRAAVGAGIVDFPTKTGANAEEYLANARAFIEKWKGDELILPCLAPHSVYACGAETLKKAGELSAKCETPLHIHLSETQWEVAEIVARHRLRPVEYLDSLGPLSGSMLAAHCIWVEDREIELLARNKVGVSHCMESNLKLASGFAPVAAMLAEGVKVTFGTDGAASNNDLSILSEMSTTAKVHKALANDPTVLDARSVMLMATRWGAEALGLGDRVGSIEAGKAADIVIADMKRPHLVPLYDVYSHIVYSMKSSDVDTVLVNGRVVVDGGRLTTADEAEIIEKAVEWGRKISAPGREH